ncbi:APC family permease [Thermomonas sp.]|uniref:APC family permease n=1 Tax=Thermomonas sp. TaxID=1971895 RepID=UPI002487F5B5|nr:APC family permease [Thermomonas sp.]MDI1253311.1 APC family permease [Thermomonas sp.]
MKSAYKKDSITLASAISMGTGVMIGAGIFALTGQIAQLAGPLFPMSFVAGAVITSVSAYAYIKMSNAYPSAGGVAMILQKAYGAGTIAAAAALLMTLSMVINESLVARTFGTYSMQLLGLGYDSLLLPALSIGLIAVAYLVNASGNRSVGVLSLIMAALKIGGIMLFGIAVLWASGFTFAPAANDTGATTLTGFVASIALSILAYKGFTTITNSGAEIVDPHRNVGRTIIISITICVVVYLLVAFAVGSSLSLPEIIQAKDYALAEAARPSLGSYGFYFTVALAITATASGLLASMFACSRMLAMLTDMKLIPHSHFGMPGGVRDHTLVYTAVIAALLTLFFDLSRIASLGAFFYLFMDIVIQWGVYRHLRREIDARGGVLLLAIGLDVLVVLVFAALKLRSDPWVVVIAVLSIASVFAFERLYLRKRRQQQAEAS